MQASTGLKIHFPATTELGNVPSEFWQKVKNAKTKILFLDYDGTLARFRVERSKARPLPGIIPVLKKLIEDKSAKIVVVSGRKIDELQGFLKHLPITLIGEHGWVKKYPNGKLELPKISLRQKQALKKIQEELSRIVQKSQLELKTCSVALHWRGLAQKQAQNSGKIAKRIALKFKKEKIFLERFNGGVEFKIPGMDKGKAVQKMIKALDRGSLIVYIGDDKTDESAFQAIKKIGFGIKVGARAGRSLAHFWLKDCDSVLQFLKRWQKLNNR